MGEKTIITTLLHLSGTVLVFWFLMFALFRKKCYRAVASTVYGLWSEKQYRTGGILLICGIMINFVLVILQKRAVITPAIDLTGFFLNWEKNAAEFFQLHRYCWLDYISVFAYFFIFPALLLSVMPILDYTGNVKVLEHYLYAIGIALFIAIPGFVLLEVREVWMNFAPGNYFSSSEICQTLFNMRSFNFPGNCFPSIHTALTIIAVYAVSKTRCSYYTVLAAVGGFLILTSILILGIHWIIDMFAGILTAFAALGLSTVVQNKRQTC